jgi:hypothetical protein
MIKNYAMPVESVGIIHSVADCLDLPWTTDLIQIATNQILLIGTDTVEA